MTSTSHRTKAGAVLAHDSAGLGSGRKPPMIKHTPRVPSAQSAAISFSVDVTPASAHFCRKPAIRSSSSSV